MATLQLDCTCAFILKPTSTLYMHINYQYTIIHLLNRKTLSEAFRHLRANTSLTSAGKQLSRPPRSTGNSRLRTPDNAQIRAPGRSSRKENNLVSSRNSEISDQSDETTASLHLGVVLASTFAGSSSDVFTVGGSELKQTIASTPRDLTSDEHLESGADAASGVPNDQPHLSRTNVEPYFNQLLLWSSDDETHRLSPIALALDPFGRTADFDGGANGVIVTHGRYCPLPTKIRFTRSGFHETYNRGRSAPTARE